MKIPEVYVKHRLRNPRQATCEADRIVGEVLREMRNDAGLSLLAVEATGIAKASILSGYERGERGCSLERLLKLAELYGVGEQMVVSVLARRVALAQDGCRTEPERAARAAEMGWT